jgi:hypothetical protein
MATCIRYYNDGSHVVDQRIGKDITIWLDFNKKYRPGCALFIDGDCKQTGYLSVDRCIEIGKNLSIPNGGNNGLNRCC